MKGSFLLIISAFLVFSSSSCFAATTFKYSGEHGETVYSQTPPQNSQAKRIITQKKRATVTTRPSAVKRLEIFTREDEHKQLAAQKAAKEKEKSLLKQKNCTTAKRNIKTYYGSPNRLVKDKNGSYTRLTSEERLKRTEAAQKNIDTFCN